MSLLSETYVTVSESQNCVGRDANLGNCDIVSANVIQLAAGNTAISGNLSRNAPFTITLSTHTIVDGQNWIICNPAALLTITLPAASSYVGREIMLKNVSAFAVQSGSSNVVPLAGGAASNVILAGSAGSKATLVSNGTNWVIMQ